MDSPLLLWIVGGALFGGLLGAAVDNSPVGIVITAMLGGGIAAFCLLLKRRTRR